MTMEDVQSIGELIEFDGATYEVMVRAPAFVIGQSSDGRRIEISDQEYRTCRSQGHVQPVSASQTNTNRIPDEAARQEQQYRIEVLRGIDEIQTKSPGV